MSRVKMTDLVNWGGDVIASPRDMLDRGLAEVRVVEHFRGERGSERRAVFVDLVGTMRGVEVSSYVATQAEPAEPPHTISFEPDAKYAHLCRPHCTCGWTISGYVTDRMAQHVIDRHLAEVAAA